MTRRSTRILAGVGWLWAAAFLITAVGAATATLVFKLPLAQAVDVLLAAQLAVLVLAELYFAARLLADLGGGRSIGAHVSAMLASLFLLAPALLAVYGFAYVRGETLTGASRVYDDVRNGLGMVFQLPAQLGSAAIVAATHGGGYVNYVAQIKSVLEAIYYGVGILISIPALRAAFARRDEGESRRA